MDSAEIQVRMVETEIRIKDLKAKLMLSKNSKEKAKREVKLKEAQYLYHWYIKQVDNSAPSLGQSE